MRYRVAFAKRVQSDGNASEMQPSAELDLNLPDGIVVEKVFVEQLETQAQHSQEVPDEDDAFLGAAAPEVWEYEVVDRRAAEFEDALRHTELVLEYDVVDSTPTDARESTPVILSEGSVYPASHGGEAIESTQTGSGVRSGDDGPAGMPTGDPSAGTLSSGASSSGTNEADLEASGDLSDLNVMKARDARLGLTNRGQKPAEDWAADTGPTRNPDRGIETDNQLDKGSTLGPDKRRQRR